MFFVYFFNIDISLQKSYLKKLHNAKIMFFSLLLRSLSFLIIEKLTLLQ